MRQGMLVAIALISACSGREAPPRIEPERGVTPIPAPPIAVSPTPDVDPDERSPRPPVAVSPTPDVEEARRPPPPVAVSPTPQTESPVGSAPPPQTESPVGSAPPSELGVPDLTVGPPCSGLTACAPSPFATAIGVHASVVAGLPELDEPWTADQRDTVNAALQPAVDGIAACYEALLAREPHVGGRVDATFTVTAGGAARDVLVNGPGDGATLACAREAVETFAVRPTPYRGRVRFHVSVEPAG